MGALIRSAAASTDQSVRSAVEHARRAAHQCLEQADIGPDEIDLLINVGVYRDENLIEPAIAALIQSDLGINPDFARNSDHIPTLSFDLMNGACGLLNAVQVAQAFLTADEARHVLITAADTHPSLAPKRPRAFPYDATGAALLLTRSADRTTGFGPVASARPADGPGMLRGYCDLTAPQARHEVTTEADPSATEHLADHAARLARDYIDRQNLDLDQVHLIVAHTVPGLPEAVAKRLGVPEQPCPNGPGPAAHTASLIIDYLAAPPAPTLLLLAAGAGLTASCAVYRTARGHHLHIAEGPQ